jgi:outer membrane biosynthesis protein TonB
MTSSTMGIEPTNPKANWIELSVICGLFVVLAVVGVIWDIASGLLTSGIDGIMMLAICLMMGGIFSLMILMMVHQAGLLPFFRHSATKAPQTAAQKAATPSAAAATPAAVKAAPAVPATSGAAAPPLQPSHPPAALQPPPPPPPPAAPKPAAKPTPAEPPKPAES